MLHVHSDGRMLSAMASVPSGGEPVNQPNRSASTSVPPDEKNATPAVDVGTTARAAATMTNGRMTSP